MDKSVVMTFRVTPKEAARIRELVGEGNFSQFVRNKLLGAGPDPLVKKVPPKEEPVFTPDEYTTRVKELETGPRRLSGTAARVLARRQLSQSSAR